MNVTIGTLAAASKSQLVAFATTATLTAASLGVVAHRQMVDIGARIDAAAASPGERHDVQAGIPSGDGTRAANQADDPVSLVGGPPPVNATPDLPADAAAADAEGGMTASPPAVGLNGPVPKAPGTVTLPMHDVVEDTVGVVEDTVGVIEDTVGVIEDTVGVIEDTVGVVEDTVGVVPDTAGGVPTVLKEFRRRPTSRDFQSRSPSQP